MMQTFSPCLAGLDPASHPVLKNFDTPSSFLVPTSKPVSVKPILLSILFRHRLLLFELFVLLFREEFLQLRILLVTQSLHLLLMLLPQGLHRFTLFFRLHGKLLMLLTKLSRLLLIHFQTGDHPLTTDRVVHLPHSSSTPTMVASEKGGSCQHATQT